MKVSSEILHPRKLTWNQKKLTIATIVYRLFLPQVRISKVSGVYMFILGCIPVPLSLDGENR